MARIKVSRRIESTRTVVWAALADLRSHVTWMRDARSIEFSTDLTSGVGTRMEVETVLGPFRTTDVMEVVSWDEGHSIEVVHHGLVRGRGTLSVSPDGGGTLVTWDETLAFPWWLGGPVTAWVAGLVLAQTWRANLERLEESLTSP
jgi:carbon monoxide dehydrogenase subunit G